jgi:hypothetical protein
MPPGWRLSAPVLLATVVEPGAAPANEILGALGETPVRVATLADAAASATADARPSALLYAVPSDSLSLETFLALLVDELNRLPTLTVTAQRIDFTLTAGKGSVGLLQYEQRPSAGDPPLHGQIAVAADPSAAVFMLLTATSAEADSPLVDDLFEATLPTLASEPYPVQSNNP